jgi:glutamate-5-semialdehyde dehydrogenase
MDLTQLFINSFNAGRTLRNLDRGIIDNILISVSEEALRKSEFILSENRKDLALMDKSDPRYDRLLLDHERLSDISCGIRNIEAMRSPLGRILSEVTRPNGLKISRVSVPFGVVGIIFESRPNVTFDVFSLCLKSGNASILKGGTEAINSNSAITGVIRDVLKEFGVDPDVLTLLPGGRDEALQLLKARDYVDLIIPRGSKGLIDFVRENSSIPVIETGAGICHTYFDEFGDIYKGRDIVNNAKTRRVSVCNALDCLIIHEARLDDLGFIVELCAGKNVEIFADEKAMASLTGSYPQELLHNAGEESYGTESSHTGWL